MKFLALIFSLAPVLGLRQHRHQAWSGTASLAAVTELQGLQQEASGSLSVDPELPPKTEWAAICFDVGGHESKITDAMDLRVKGELPPAWALQLAFCKKGAEGTTWVPRDMPEAEMMEGVTFHTATAEECTNQGKELDTLDAKNEDGGINSDGSLKDCKNSMITATFDTPIGCDIMHTQCSGKGEFTWSRVKGLVEKFKETLKPLIDEKMKLFNCAGLCAEMREQGKSKFDFKDAKSLEFWGCL